MPDPLVPLAVVSIEALAIALVCALAMRFGLDRWAGQLAAAAVPLTLAWLLVGVHQRYGLIDDPWRLYAAAALVGVPWLLATRSLAVLVVMVGLILVSLEAWWPLDGLVPTIQLAVSMAGVVALAWIGWRRHLRASTHATMPLAVPNQGASRLRTTLAVLGTVVALGVAVLEVGVWERLWAGGDPVAYLVITEVRDVGVRDGQTVPLRYALNDYLDRFVEDGEPVWRDWPTRGTLAVRLDEAGVASAARWHGGQPLRPGEVAWRYRRIGDELVLAAPGWPVAREGANARYPVEAHYAVVRLGPGGEPMVVGMADADRSLIRRIVLP